MTTFLILMSAMLVCRVSIAVADLGEEETGKFKALVLAGIFGMCGLVPVWFCCFGKGVDPIESAIAATYGSVMGLLAFLLVLCWCVSHLILWLEKKSRD